MRVTAESEQPMTEEAVRAATGRGWHAWYALLDGAGGTAPGRRAITESLMREHGLAAWWAQTIAVEYEGARGVREKDGRPRGYAICVTRTIAAPATAVFDAFGSPAALGVWLADGAGAEAALVEGARFSTGDGNAGRYTKLARPKTLRLVWDDADPSLASTVELKLTEKDGKCGLVLNHERIQTRALADGLRAAWGGAIDRLKRLLER